MKILCVIDSLGSGGAQRQLVELAIALKAEKNDVSFLTYHNHDFYKLILHQSGIKTYCIEEESYIKRLFKMRKFIRQGQYDNVISFLEAANFISEISGFPYRRWNLIVGERSANPNILKSIKLRFYRFFHFFATYIVANSGTNLSMVRQINPLLPKSKCKVIYNIIDPDKWRSSLEKDYKHEGKLKIVIASSHQHLKNLVGLIHAVNLLDEEEKDKLEIEWYGDHGFDTSYDDGLMLLEKFKIRNVFSFHDATHEIKQKFESADVVGLFSHYEGLPNAICEGMMVGRPIIATNVSDLPLIVDTECGFLCDSTDFQSIAAGLRFYLNIDTNTLAKMGEISRQKAISLFSKQNIISSYKALLKY